MSSISRRLISGSLANWAFIVSNSLLQLGTVPLLLKYWSAQEFGLWVLLQTLFSLSTVLDLGHQNYIGYEFQKHSEPSNIEKLFFASMPIALSIGLLQLGFWVAMSFSGGTQYLFSSFVPENMISDFNMSLMIYAASWIITGSVGGLLGRSVIPLGHYARVAWWRLFSLVTGNVGILVAVFVGYDILHVVMIFCLTNIAANVPIFADCISIWRKNKMGISVPNINIGISNFFRSLFITAREVVIISNQQGIRLVIAPLIGVHVLGQFTATRTISNIAMQAINAISGPMEPEFIRFLRRKEQESVDRTIIVICGITITVVGVGAFILQIVAPYFFQWWTQGHFILDPILFGLLTIVAIVYAAEQPLVMIVRGNNMLYPQLLSTVSSLLVTVGGSLILIPNMGVQGAAIALLVAEIVSLIIYLVSSSLFLANQGLTWPFNIFILTLGNAAAVSTAIIFNAVSPDQRLLWLMAITALSLFSVVLCVRGFRGRTAAR